MKNIKISNDIHQEIKQISTQEGMTMDGVLRKLLQVEKAEYQKAESPGGNTVQKPNTTVSTSQVEKGEKGADNQKDGWIIYDEEGNEKVKVSSKDVPLTEKKFCEFLRELRPFVQDLLKVKENVHFCPNCGHVLYLHSQSHTSHSTPEFYEYSKAVGSIYGEGGCYHLECPRCGYYVDLEKPKWWRYKDKEKQVVDLRNEEGKKGHSEEAEQDEECKSCSE